MKMHVLVNMYGHGLTHLTQTHTECLISRSWRYTPHMHPWRDAWHMRLGTYLSPDTQAHTHMCPRPCLNLRLPFRVPSRLFSVFSYSGREVILQVWTCPPCSPRLTLSPAGDLSVGSSPDQAGPHLASPPCLPAQCPLALSWARVCTWLPSHPASWLARDPGPYGYPPRVTIHGGWGWAHGLVSGAESDAREVVVGSLHLLPVACVLVALCARRLPSSPPSPGQPGSHTCRRLLMSESSPGLPVR